jgi:NAD(P)-dependent dehydrogenase (short-subunit alcohol dehydrogenase family)
MVKTCTDLYGRIDVVDYNVGLAHLGGVVELPEEEWDRIFAVSLEVDPVCETVGAAR